MNGVLSFSWWQMLLFVILATHITATAVTIFLHRSLAHLSVQLSPVVNHFFRLWLWLTTGIVSRQWVAVHRKHHATCDTENDPHSPLVYGLGTVLISGAELYRKAAADENTITQYGHGTPNDWLERRLYARWSFLGVAILFFAYVFLFRPLGITAWALQMLWTPVFAAGVINGMGHAVGYRRFQTLDASTNIVPLGVFIGGEELHNNHHAYPSSARFSHGYEIDIGYLYIRLLRLVGLAEVKRLAPPLFFREKQGRCDRKTVEALIVHEPRILAMLSRLFGRIFRDEVRRLRRENESFFIFHRKELRGWFFRKNGRADVGSSVSVKHVLRQSRSLRAFETFRLELLNFLRTQMTFEDRSRWLEAWCKRAESEDILELTVFVEKLRGSAIEKESGVYHAW